MNGRFFDIQRFSLHDGPGIRTTVFLKGCSLRCAWCQNPEGIRPEPELMFTREFCVNCGECWKACPNGMHRIENGIHTMERSRCVVCGRCAEVCIPQALRIVGHDIAVADVMKIVREDRVYYEKSGGGMTLSGGDPLIQAGFAAKLLAACRKEGFHTAVDTALDVDWKAVERVIPFTDLFLADIKHTDPVRHEQGTGRSNARILANLRELNLHGAAIVVRVPVIPGFNDGDGDIGAIAALAASLENVRYVELLPYHKLGEPKSEALGGSAPMREAAPLSREILERLVRVAEAKGAKVKGTRNKDAATERRGHTERWQERLDAIHALKLRHTAEKQKKGPRDIDDWGDIPLEGKSFTFRPETTHPKGYVLGPRDCGRNFRRFLEAVPTYVDRNSSLLGGWYLAFGQFVTGWDPEGYWNDLVPEFKKYGVIHGIDNNQHFLCDVQIGLDLGFGGLLAKIERYRKVNIGPEAQAYYDGMTDFVLGIQGWIRRHVEAARSEAAGTAVAWEQKNLLEMADMNDRLATKAPATFREACQWLAWYQMAKRMYIGGGSLGRLDLLLLPYYDRDVKAGILDEDEAIFHLACFLVKDSHYIQLGGMDTDGNDQTNRLSFLFLEAAHRVKVPANLAVAVHEKTDPGLMRRATELLFVDKMGIPRFAGMQGVVDGMVKRGFPLEIARQRVQAGCHWFGIPGREYCFNDTIKINFAKVFEVALDEMLGEPIPPDGLPSAGGDPAGTGKRPNVRRLWRLFEKHLARAVNVTARGIDFHIEHEHRYYPELALSLLCHGPIEKGVDASHGSVDYVNVGVDGAALATVADSFAAIEQRVEKEGVVTWSELSCALNQKWWRCGRIRAWMENVPGYGRGGTRGDWWAERISKCFSDMVVEQPTPAGHRMTPGLFSWASTISMGRETGATPDGRGAGDPISFGANPNPGRLRGGPLVPTAMSTAVARVHPPYGNPAPLQFDVDPGLVSDEDGVEKFDAFIRAHFTLGGTLINANILDRDKVLDACRNPSKYPDLVVRVTGFSVYFASLSDAFRQLVYDRVVAMEG